MLHQKKITTICPILLQLALHKINYFWRHEEKIQQLHLTIKERLLFPVLFPEKADKLTQIICDGIEKKIGITAEEIEKFKIEAIPNGWKWDGKFDEETFPIELTESEATVLKDQSRRLDREQNITRQMLSLIKKIDAM